jgi:hypothetical protein
LPNFHNITRSRLESLLEGFVGEENAFSKGAENDQLLDKEPH